MEEERETESKHSLVVSIAEDGDLKLVVPVRLNQMRPHIRNYVNIANVRLRCEK
jgi:hypothetical protein